MKNSYRNAIIAFVSSFTMVSLAFTIAITPAYSQQIITDGYTKTNLDVAGKVTTVTTKTIKGSNAFNSFSKFDVYKGNTVNLVVPGKSNNLINIIKDEATNIDGTLNSLKNGHVGGNVLLVNPYGIIVSSSGKVNTGSLTTVTPTKDYVDNFFDSPGNPNSGSVISLLNGKTPQNPDASVIIKGSINAVGGEKLDYIPKFGTEDVVNIGNLENNESMILKDNQITGTIANIKAEYDPISPVGALYPWPDQPGAKTKIKAKYDPIGPLGHLEPWPDQP